MTTNPATTDLDSLSREELLTLVRRQQAEIAALKGMDEPQPAPTPAGATRGVLAALVALLAAAVGEYILRTQDSPLPAIALYAVAALVLAATSARFVLRRVPAARRDAPSFVWVAGSGGAVTVTLAVLAFLALNGNLRDPAGFWLWLASIVAALATGVAAWFLEAPAPRWLPALPATRRARVLLVVAVVLILAAAVAARVYALDRIPFGINPDEGDRTANAMQVVRGTTGQTLFESGWYRISMMYFTLLARWLEWWGIGYVQARLFTALFGVVSVAGVIWIGLRQWGTRVGLFAGGALALMGLALQFARETSEAGPTAALWVISVALLLEGARAGRLLAWIGAGLAGGYSLYFYPSGRLWPLLAALLGVYLLARWWGSGRAAYVRLGRGLAAAALAAAAIAAPFFAHALQYPREFALRFAETSVLRPENAARLHYVAPDWSLPRLLAEQTGRSLGVFSRFPDGAGFWPMREPVLGGVLAALLLLGLGYCLLRLRDPRGVALALWFGVSISGMILTVETPNIQRLATGVPALALFMAVVLDEVIARVGSLRAADATTPPDARRPPARTLLLGGATLLAALVLAGALAAEVRFYFRDYARMNLWMGWNQEGRALTLLPPETLHTSLGTSFHMVNSGWVRLLAPQAVRGGVRSPGALLPLPEDGSRGLSFLLYPPQGAYIPWLLALYPGMRTVDYALEGESTYFTYLYAPPEVVAATRGARVFAAGSDATNPTALASPWPAAEQDGAPATYTAVLRVPQEGNYALRVGPGPATLWVDGRRALDVEPGRSVSSVVLHLARGDLALRVEGTRRLAPVEWAQLLPGMEPIFAPLAARDLALPLVEGPHGWAARVNVEAQPERWRQDNALATCCIVDMLHSDNRPTRAEWSGSLIVAEPGDHTFHLTLPGPGALRIDGAVVAETSSPAGATLEATVPLATGSHPATLTLEVARDSNRALELAWTPPGGPLSILPAQAVRPDLPLTGPPLPDEVLAIPGAFPPDQVLDTIE